MTPIARLVPAGATPEAGGPNHFRRLGRTGRFVHLAA